MPPLLRLVRSGRHARQAHVGGDFLLDYDADDDFVEFVSSFRVGRTMKDWGVEDSPTDGSCRLIPPSCFTRSSAILNPAAVGPEAITFARAITAPTPLASYGPVATCLAPGVRARTEDIIAHGPNAGIRAHRVRAAGAK